MSIRRSLLPLSVLPLFLLASACGSSSGAGAKAPTVAELRRDAERDRKQSGAWFLAELTLPDGKKVSFPIDAFAQHCLLNGIDQLGYILGFDDKIKSYEASHA
jgi:hypothetical protein